MDGFSWSGLFLFVRAGSFARSVGLSTDGLLRDYVTGIVADVDVTLDTIVMSRREMHARVEQRGTRVAPSLVATRGLGDWTLGKGVFTLETGIRNRCGKDADTLIAAFKAAQVEQKAA